MKPGFRYNRSMEKIRLGALIIPNRAWNDNEAALRRAIGGKQTGEVLPALKDGRYMASVHVTFIHPEFDELDDPDGLIPIYECDLSIEPNGKATRGPMRRVQEPS
jgi:hypothetical protein